MITDCFGAMAWDFADVETVFVYCTLSLMRIIIPAAIWLLTWRLCDTERSHHRGRVQVLGLDESSPDLTDQVVSPYLLPLCIATTIFTFVLGLLIS